MPRDAAGGGGEDRNVSYLDLRRNVCLRFRVIFGLADMDAGSSSGTAIMEKVEAQVGTY